MSNSKLNILSAIIFCVFVFCLIFFFQDENIAVAQNVLSGGKTVYRPIVGALLITIFLYALQRLVFFLLPVRGRLHALTYLPSFLALMLIVDIASCIAVGSTCWHLLFAVPIALFVLYFLYNELVKYIKFYRQRGRSPLLSRDTWINLVLIVAMMIPTILIGSVDKQAQKNVTSSLATIKKKAEHERQMLIKAEQDSLRAIFVHDSRAAVKDSIRLERQRKDSLERIGKLL